MLDDIQLRSATMADADDLLKWRNDIETRQASHNMDIIALASHLVWLESSLNTPEQRRLWIAEIEGVSVGSCRADYGNGMWELSWMVAPEYRHQGVASRMLQELLKALDGTLSVKPSLLAQIKTGNTASIKVAESVGFVLDKQVNGVLFYRFP